MIGTRMVSDPEIGVHEREIRPLALSRKNSLFAGSEGGAGH